MSRRHFLQTPFPQNYVCLCQKERFFRSSATSSYYFYPIFADAQTKEQHDSMSGRHFLQTPFPQNYVCLCQKERFFRSSATSSYYFYPIFADAQTKSSTTACRENTSCRHLFRRIMSASVKKSDSFEAAPRPVTIFILFLPTPKQRAARQHVGKTLLADTFSAELCLPLSKRAILLKQRHVQLLFLSYFCRRPNKEQHDSMSGRHFLQTPFPQNYVCLCQKERFF